MRGSSYWLVVVLMIGLGWRVITGQQPPSIPGVGSAATTGGPLSGPLIGANINAIRYAEQFPGPNLGAKIAAAISDLPSTGGVVVTTVPGDFSNTTINVGSSTKPVALFLNGFGNWTCSGNPCFELGQHSAIYGLNSRSTEISSSNAAGPIIRSTSPAESWDVHDLWLQGGLNAIKTRGNSSTTDVPSIHIGNIFAQNQAGTALQIVGLADLTVIDTVFVNSPGADCLRVGLFDNGEVMAASNENARAVVYVCFSSETVSCCFVPVALRSHEGSSGVRR
jgi:hypothetical protein